MTAKTWYGANGAFTNGLDWSPTGAPASGDDAYITAGTVLASTSFVDALTIVLEASSVSTPRLDLTGATLLPHDEIALLDGGATATVQFADTVTNTGVFASNSTGLGSAEYVFADAPDAAAAVLVNTGLVVDSNGSSRFVNFGGNTGNTIINNGLFVFEAPQGSTTGFVGLPITGTGTIKVGVGASLDLASAVGSGQTVQFETTAGGALQLDQGGTFAGTIAGFGGNDTIQLTSGIWTEANYASNGANAGTLTLSNNGVVVSQLAFSGAYTLDNFVLPESVDATGTVGTTPITAATLSGFGRFSSSDVVTGVNARDTGLGYNGPVANLQYQYLWSSADAVAISANVPNVFVKGGPAGDALSVSGGTNVLDGSGGSNFLVGATGNSQDTFYVDGRGGAVTWSTIVNFHLGDSATFFGFQAGVSTLPFTASDGAAGYTGVTIHSELAGSGTGVNESMTFTGLTQADVNNHFAITTGTLSPNTANPIPYLLIQYNH